LGVFVSGSRQNRRSLSLLGDAIREARHQRGMEIPELAAATGLEVSRIEAVEAGRLDPDFALLLALSSSMGLRPSAFVLRAEQLAGERPASENGNGNGWRG
jgi:transcriptional regulator with XRE-family HTH domain